jgi:adenosylcobinamide-phosphate synthase
MAHGLGIALSGPRSYDGELRDFPFVNDAGEHALTSDHIDRTITVLWKTWALTLIVAAGLFLLGL